MWCGVGDSKILLKEREMFLMFDYYYYYWHCRCGYSVGFQLDLADNRVSVGVTLRGMANYQNVEEALEATNSAVLLCHCVGARSTAAAAINLLQFPLGGWVLKLIVV